MASNLISTHLQCSFFFFLKFLCLVVPGLLNVVKFYIATALYSLLISSLEELGFPLVKVNLNCIFIQKKEKQSVWYTFENYDDLLL